MRFRFKNEFRMKFWHVLTMFAVFCAGLYFRPKKTPQIASNYYVIGSNKLMKHHDSIVLMEYNVDDSVVLMVRLGDTIRIDSVAYVMKLNTFKID